MTHLRTLALAAACLLALPLVAAEPDKYLPDNTTSIVSVNVKQVLGSALGQKYLAPLMQKALKDNAELTLALNAFGFDPLKDFDSVTVASPGIGSIDPKEEASKAIVILHGTFDLAKIESTAEALIKKNPDKVKTTKEGAVTIYESKANDQAAFVAFLDKTTAILAGTKANVVTAIKTGGKGPKLGKEMTALLAKANAKQSVWMAAVTPPEMKKLLKGEARTAEMADKILAFTGGVTFDKDVAASLTIHTADAATAQDIAGALETVKIVGKTALDNPDVTQQLGQDLVKMAADVIDGIKIASSRSDATVDLKVSEAAILKVLEIVNPK